MIMVAERLFVFFLHPLARGTTTAREKEKTPCFIVLSDEENLIISRIVVERNEVQYFILAVLVKFSTA
jgi:hypothetical protein